MSSVSSQLIGMKSATAINNAGTESSNSKTVDSNAFLTLLLKQLEYQDPLNPVDNTEFLSQQAQFTQLSTIQEMSSNIASNNAITQACSLIGKTVTLVDPNDKTKTITGEVSTANFSSDSTPTITVNGKEYPIGYVTNVATKPPSTTTTTGEA